MNARRWTCERLARQLGVSMMSVWKWRSGTRPDYENIHKIRKLTRGKVKEEDWPPKGSKPGKGQRLATTQAQRLAEADAFLTRE